MWKIAIFVYCVVAVIGCVALSRFNTVLKSVHPESKSGNSFALWYRKHESITPAPKAGGHSENTTHVAPPRVNQPVVCIYVSMSRRTVQRVGRMLPPKCSRTGRCISEKWQISPSWRTFIRVFSTWRPRVALGISCCPSYHLCCMQKYLEFHFSVVFLSPLHCRQRW